MNIKHMTINYRIDVTKDAFIEYIFDADEDKMSAAYSNGTIHAELWIKEKENLWEYDEDFLTDATDKNGNVFDVNLCHALLCVKIEGTGSNNVDFAYEYKTGELHSLSIDGHDAWGFELARSGQTMREWLDGIDEFIVQKVN